MPRSRLSTAIYCALVLSLGLNVLLTSAVFNTEKQIDRIFRGNSVRSPTFPERSPETEEPLEVNTEVGRSYKQLRMSMIPSGAVLTSFKATHQVAGFKVTEKMIEVFGLTQHQAALIQSELNKIRRHVEHWERENSSLVHTQDGDIYYTVPPMDVSLESLQEAIRENFSSSTADMLNGIIENSYDFYYLGSERQVGFIDNGGVVGVEERRVLSDGRTILTGFGKLGATGPAGWTYERYSHLDGIAVK